MLVMLYLVTFWLHNFIGNIGGSDNVQHWTKYATVGIANWRCCLSPVQTYSLVGRSLLAPESTWI